MKINNDITKSPAFAGGAMSPLTSALYTLSNNDMLNASFVDLFAMDTPRTIVEFKNRGKEAGIEMGFREYTGTFIAEFSAAVFALGVSKLFSKFYKPDVKVNSGSWATNSSLEVFDSIYKTSDSTPEGFVKNALNSMTGLVGNKTKAFSDIDEEKAKPVIDGLVNLITDKNISKKDYKKASEGIQTQIVNLLGADNNVTLKSQGKEFSSNLTHAIRDLTDLGKNVFFKEGAENSDKIISKLKTMNKSRIAIAIPLSMGLAITNQYINRRLTKKRTGIDNFVGENGYEQNVKDKKQSEGQKGLLAKKMLSAGVFLAMLTKVMGVQKPSDFVSKLEFTGPATGGNAIKTIYGTLILGRIFASKDSTELRETNVRDYLGFLNWLVLGGFVSKGVAQALDPKREALFNVAKEGKGVVHWLKDISLKSQKEIIAQGGDIKSNLRKLNAAQLAGIGYSALMLGFFLPKLNIWMTKRGGKNKEQQNNTVQNPSFDSVNPFRQNTAKAEKGTLPFQALKFDEFLNKAKMNSRNA
ncbi:MAG: hypothetical protein Q4F80_03430 [bacterium]|nr:hypothetical protein [bacterium]